MKYCMEVQTELLKTIKASLVGKKVEHEDGQFTITEVKDDRYFDAPCLVAILQHDQIEDLTEELAIRAGMLEN